MARHLKTSISEAEKQEELDKVRQIVEQTLAEIESNGDAAVRKMSTRFDN